MKQTAKKSNYVQFYRQQNECHEIDDERAGSIIGNLSRDPQMLKTNPYYNRRLLKTTHATYLDSESLYKLGQLTMDQLIQEKQSTQNKSMVTTSRFQNNKTRNHNRLSMIEGINSYNNTNLETFMEKRGHRRQSQALVT